MKQARGRQADWIWILAFGLIVYEAAQAQSAMPVAEPSDIVGVLSEHHNFPDFLTPPSDIAFANWRTFDAWPVRLGPNEGVMRSNGIMGGIEYVDSMLVRRKPAGRFAFFANDRELAPAIALLDRTFPDVNLDAATITGENVFIVDSSPVGDGAAIPRDQRNTASTTLRYVSAQSIEREGEPRVQLHSAWFTVFDTAPAQKPAAPAPAPATSATQPRGVILLMSGLLGTPEGTLSQLTRSLTQNDWVVLRMVAQPSRFLERVEFTIDPASPGFPGAVAASIARTFDERGAECAFAAQAAFAFLLRERPELKDLPRVAIGFSGGAMTLPTVVAREPDDYAAAIIIGGGCDFWLMTQTSNYNQWIGAVHATWTNEASDADKRAVDKAYLRASRLDSYHTAQALANKPVLVMLGDMDQAVPAPLGELLIARLEKAGAKVTPIRQSVGHEALFMTLPRRFATMHAWLDEHFLRANDVP